MSRMPVLFVGRGSPMNTLRMSRFTRAWGALGATLPRPRANAMGSLSMTCYAVGREATSVDIGTAAASLPPGIPADETNT